MWSTALARAQAYAHHPDPLVELGNRVSLLVASNQPFYPLYLYFLVTDEITAALFTFLSTPFFLAVPAVSRWNAAAGRALLPLTGIANTVLCAKLFGVQSAVETFLIPCGLLAIVLFRPGERLVALSLAGVALAAYVLAGGGYGAPWHAYSDAEYEALARLNAVSASMLVAFVGLLMANRHAQAEAEASVAEPGRDEKAAG